MGKLTYNIAVRADPKCRLRVRSRRQTGGAHMPNRQQRPSLFGLERASQQQWDADIPKMIRCCLYMYGRFENTSCVEHSTVTNEPHAIMLGARIGAHRGDREMIYLVKPRKRQSRQQPRYPAQPNSQTNGQCERSPRADRARRTLAAY